MGGLQAGSHPHGLGRTDRWAKLVQDVRIPLLARLIRKILRQIVHDLIALHMVNRLQVSVVTESQIVRRLGRPASAGIRSATAAGSWPPSSRPSSTSCKPISTATRNRKPGAGSPTDHPRHHASRYRPQPGIGNLGQGRLPAHQPGTGIGRCRPRADPHCGCMVASCPHRLPNPVLPTFAPIAAGVPRIPERLSPARSGAAAGCPERGIPAVSDQRHDGGGTMTTAMALPGNTTSTFLTHFFGRGLEDERYVVERYKARADGDIVPILADAPKSKGRRKARRVTATLKTVKELRPAPNEIIICTALNRLPVSGVGGVHSISPRSTGPSSTARTRSSVSTARSSAGLLLTIGVGFWRSFRWPVALAGRWRSCF